MDKHLALLTLGLQPDAGDEEIQEALEQKIFDLRNYVLSQPVIAKLFQARIAKLEQLALLQPISSDDDHARLSETSNLENQDLLSLLMSYERSLAHVRLLAAGTLSARQLARYTGQLIAIQRDFESCFLEHTTDVEPGATVQAAHPFPSGQVIVHLKAGNMEAVVDTLRTEKARILALIPDHR